MNGNDVDNYDDDGADVCRGRMMMIIILMMIIMMIIDDDDGEDVCRGRLYEFKWFIQ